MAETFQVWKIGYEYVGVPTQLYRGHGVERSSIYPQRGRTYDEIKPLNVIPKVENGIPTGIPTRQWHGASPVGRSSTDFRETTNTGKLRVMRRKRVSKPLKITVEWTPGVRTIAWEDLWRRILLDALRAVPRNSDLEECDGCK